MHRGRYKPGGNPRRAAILPRGIIIGPALNSPWQGDAISGRAPMGKAAYGGGYGDFAFFATAYGMGARLQWTEHNYASNEIAGTFPFTVDCLYLPVNAPSGKTVLRFGSRSSGTNCTLSIASGFFQWNWHNGSNRTLASTTAPVAGGLYHVAVTNDRVAGNETTRLYVNGVLEAAVSYAGAAGALDRPTLQIGSAGNDNTTYILMATVSTAAWTAEEVAARSRDPYSHLEWDDRDLISGWWGASALVPFDGISAAVLGITGSAAGAVAVAGAASAALGAAGTAAGEAVVAGVSAAILAGAGAATGTVAVSAASAAVWGLAGSFAGGMAIAATSAVTLRIVGTMAGGAVIENWPDWVPPGRRVSIGADVRRVAIATDRRAVSIPPDRRRSPVGE
jgi:hypothetical protein